MWTHCTMIIYQTSLHTCHYTCCVWDIRLVPFISALSLSFPKPQLHTAPLAFKGKTENIPETSVCRFHPSLYLCSAFHAALCIPGKISTFSYQGHTVLTASTRKLSCVQEAVCSRKQRIHSAHLHSKYKLGKLSSSLPWQQAPWMFHALWQLCGGGFHWVHTGTLLPISPPPSWGNGVLHVGTEALIALITVKQLHKEGKAIVYEEVGVF